MSQKELDEAYVTFEDVSAYFSQEEWKLLQDWQKELYKNVMKEIHHALISLGPLIATTVCSLRVKEKENVFPMDNEGSEERHRTNHCTGDMVANVNMQLKINNEEPLQGNSGRDSDGMSSEVCPSTVFPYANSDISLRKEEDPVSIFIDHYGTEMGETRAERNSADYEVVSFRIKEEEGANCIDHENSKRVQSISRPVDYEVKKRKHKMRDSAMISGNAIPRKSSTGGARVKTTPRYDKGTLARPLIWSEMFQEQGAEESTPIDRELSNPPYHSFHQGTLKLHSTEKYSDESYMCDANLFADEPHLHETMTIYSCSICEKAFNKKEYLFRHKRTHIGVRPHQCPECNKSFRRKDTLSVHRRTHTGERPYHCAICKKSFNQVGALNRHKRTHVGDRPYQCHLCEKRFTQNGTLIAHQKTHNFPRNRLSSQV